MTHYKKINKNTTYFFKKPFKNNISNIFNLKITNKTPHLHTEIKIEVMYPEKTIKKPNYKQNYINQNQKYLHFQHPKHPQLKTHI